MTIREAPDIIGGPEAALDDVGGGWNYRIMRHVDQHGDKQDIYYAIHEVYYREDGSVRIWTQEPCGSPFGETLSEMVNDLAWISAGVARPVLNFEDGSETAPAPLLEDELLDLISREIPPSAEGTADNEGGLRAPSRRATEEARSEGIREAAAAIERTANLSAESLRLKYGEMSSQEIRTLRAVLEQQVDAIMRMASIEIGDPDGEADAA